MSYAKDVLTAFRIAGCEPVNGDQDRNELRANASELGVELDDLALERLEQFARLVVEGNRVQNLTRIPPGHMNALHFLDSLSLAAAVRPKPGWEAVDVGTGAGFPGVPLAIAFQETRFALVEATGKRAEFVARAIGALDLSNARVCHGRAEDLSKLPAYARRFDLAVARAVARLPRLVPWLMPFLKPGACAVAYKSVASDEELLAAREALAASGAALDRAVDVVLPGSGIRRKLVVLRRAGPPISRRISTGRRS
ncbi:MAG TPA: 16S rRNA (guanine(527)-N(7))-methyltransferase RsmG [Chthonomonadales bacterium]|nr:16S rRNA (guanine(527)-N(7))-methyltransferase RsmG [Chthonomonadales bacterium]